MARLPYLDEADLAEGDRTLLSRPINLMRLLVHSPGLARGMGALGAHTRKNSKLDKRYSEIAILTMGWLAKSPYEWSHHIAIGRDAGVTDEDIHAIMGLAEPEPVAGLVIRAGTELYEGPGISEATLTDLKKHFDNECLVDLVFAMSLYCGVVRLLDSFAVDVEPAYMPYLREFPLAA